MKFKYVVSIALILFLQSHITFAMKIDAAFVKQNGTAALNIEKIIDGEKSVYDQYVYNVPHNFLGLTWYTTCYIHRDVKNPYSAKVDSVVILVSAKTKALVLALPISVLTGCAYLLWKKFH